MLSLLSKVGKSELFFNIFNGKINLLLWGSVNFNFSYSRDELADNARCTIQLRELEAAPSPLHHNYGWIKIFPRTRRSIVVFPVHFNLIDASNSVTQEYFQINNRYFVPIFLRLNLVVFYRYFKRQITRALNDSLSDIVNYIYTGVPLKQWD